MRLQRPTSIEQLWVSWNEIRLHRQEIFYESRLLLKLRELNISDLRPLGMDSADSRSPEGDSMNGASILRSLSSIVSKAIPSQTGNTSSEDKNSIAMLLQTPHEQYAELVKELGAASRVERALKIYGDSQILSHEQVTNLRKVRFKIFCCDLSIWTKKLLHKGLIRAAPVL